MISLEQEIRRGKQTETDLYKELDEALKDLENVSNRYPGCKLHGRLFKTHLIDINHCKTRTLN